jgi:hypothetical protein
VALPGQHPGSSHSPQGIGGGQLLARMHVALRDQRDFILHLDTGVTGVMQGLVRVVRAMRQTGQAQGFRDRGDGVAFGFARRDIRQREDFTTPDVCFRSACVNLGFHWPTVILKGTQ